MSYLGNLDAANWRRGAMQMPDDFRQRHAGFLTKGRREDGGFAGRQGTSDLYYTGFAVRGLTLLGALTEEDAEQTAEFLQAKPFSRAGCRRLPFARVCFRSPRSQLWDRRLRPR